MLPAFFILHCIKGAFLPRPYRAETMTEAIKFISTKLGAWRRYRASLRELYCLTDRELSDLGIARWEIDDVARRSAGL
jgi:uncharacterized protein YjiS (DUF1127 family)